MSHNLTRATKQPLANYKNVVTAVNRISQDLGIGARKITVSTVGIVANIRKLTTDPNVPQVRLAVSLHCVDDEERTALLPANDRNGGLKELMSVLREYIDTTGRRITLEWALIAGENDDQGTARKLGRLVKKYRLRPDMVHVNVIPLNPTSAYEGKPSQKGAVNLFCETLQQEFGIACTPRVRRGIDIDAGCGQLTTAILQKERDTKQLPSKETGTAARQLSDFMPDSSFHPPQSTSVGFFQDDDDGDTATIHSSQAEFKSKYSLDCTVDVHDFDHEDFEDPELKLMEEKQEASRLISLIQGTTIHLGDIN